MSGYAQSIENARPARRCHGDAMGRPRDSLLKDMQPAMQEIDANNVNHSIIELKKKIQLSEGRRKALFEESQSELRKNVDRIRLLVKDVAALRLRYRRPVTADGTDGVRKCNDSRQRRVLSGKRPAMAADLVQMQVNDLNKKLDLLRYQTAQSKERLRALADELKALKRKSTGSVIADREEGVPRGMRSIGQLENRIHRLELGLLEADHVRRKYLAIRASLLDDGNEFDSALRALEDSLRVQEGEIARLRARAEEACALRDATRAQLTRREAAEARAARARTHQLQDLKSRVEQRRNALSRLERFMFPPPREDSQGSGDEVNDDQVTRKPGNSTDAFDSAFSRLKTATGAADVDEVLKRFLAQNETRQRLAYLRRGAEEEKQRLLKRRDNLLARLDGNKFAQAKEDEPDADAIDAAAEEAELRHNEALRNRAAAEEVRIQLSELGKALRRICVLVMHLDDGPLPPEDTEAALVLQLLEQKIRSGLARLGSETSNREEASSPPPAPSSTAIATPAPTPTPTAKTLFPAMEPPPAPSVETSTSASASEDDTCPTRPFLKRQAQLIVDAKSRRKTLRAAAIPRAAH